MTKMSAKLNPPCTKYPEDGALVGTDAIFSSKNVIPPPNIQPEIPIPLPPKDDGIPAPSIYFDDRGEIHNVRIQRNDQRINILYTKKGHLRSGDMHPNEQCDFIFSGRVNVWTLSKDGSTNVQTYGKHEFVKIPRGVPHVFEFLEDSVIAEWWEPQGFQCWFYRPYREIVDTSFLGLRGPSNGDAGDEYEGGDNDYENGYHRRLVELTPVIPEKCNQSWFHAVLLVAGAAVVGLSGFSLGRRYR